MRGGPALKPTMQRSERPSTSGPSGRKVGRPIETNSRTGATRARAASIPAIASEVSSGKRPLDGSTISDVL